MKLNHLIGLFFAIQILTIQTTILEGMRQHRYTRRQNPHRRQLGIGDRFTTIKSHIYHAQPGSFEQCYVLLTPEEWVQQLDEYNNNRLMQLMRHSYATCTAAEFESAMSFICYIIDQLLQTNKPFFEGPEASIWVKNDSGEDIIHVAARRSMTPLIIRLLQIRKSIHGDEELTSYISSKQKQCPLFLKCAEGCRFINTNLPQDYLEQQRAELTKYMTNLHQTLGLPIPERSVFNASLIEYTGQATQAAAAAEENPAELPKLWYYCDPHEQVYLLLGQDSNMYYWNPTSASWQRSCFCCYHDTDRNIYWYQPGDNSIPSVTLTPMTLAPNAKPWIVTIGDVRYHILPGE